MLQDAAQYNEASYTPDMAREIDSLGDHIAELAEGWQKNKPVAPQVEAIVRRLLDEKRLNESVEVAQLSGREVLAQIVALIVESERPKLMAQSVDLVFQLGVFGGISETEMARQAGCTRANACHYVMRVKDRFFRGVSIPWLRSEEARTTYSKRQEGKQINHEPWPFAEVLNKEAS